MRVVLNPMGCSSPILGRQLILCLCAPTGELAGFEQTTKFTSEDLPWTPLTLSLSSLSVAVGYMYICDVFVGGEDKCMQICWDSSAYY